MITLCRTVASLFSERRTWFRGAAALQRDALRPQSPRLLYIGTRKLWPKQRRSARGSVNTKHSLAYRLKRNLYSVRLPRLRRKTELDAEKQRGQRARERETNFAATRGRKKGNMGGCRRKGRFHSPKSPRPPTNWFVLQLQCRPLSNSPLYLLPSSPPPLSHSVFLLGYTGIGTLT